MPSHAFKNTVDKHGAVLLGYHQFFYAPTNVPPLGEFRLRAALAATLGT